MLHCSDCGRHLIGDTGRYRHPDACEAFTAVRREPRKRAQGQRKNMPGTSYRADEYEAIVREVLANVSLGAELVAAVVGETRDAEPDRLAIARIGRERDATLARYRRDRDLRTLERTMATLDEQEAEANAGGPAEALEASEVVAYLRDLPRLWDDAPGSRRALAEALFERVEVLGLRQMRIEPTPSAIAAGLVEAFSRASAGYGRGERGSPATTDLSITMRLADPKRMTRRSAIPTVSGACLATPPDAPPSERSASLKPSSLRGRRRRPPTASGCRTRPSST
jgi:hypothetical protein